MMRRTLILALNLVGVFDAGYLLWVYTSPSSPMICLGGGTGCDTVRASSYANLFGVPLPAYGVLMYVTLGLLIFAESLVSARLASLIRSTIAGISGFGFLFSLYLTGIAAFVLHASCTWCLISALCTTLIFALAVWSVARPGLHPEPVAALALARRHFVLFAVALLVGTPSLYFLVRSAEIPPMPAVSAESLHERLVRSDSHITGNLNASVTIVEFGDFQCLPCGRAEPAVREIRRKYGDRIRFVFRHFPIEKLHPQSRKAAEASECAAEQGKFWEAAEKFFQEQNDLSEAALERYAGEIGLERERFRQCLSSGAGGARVERDLQDALALGLRATPTFIIGRRLVEGPLPLAGFSQLIDQELASSGVTAAKALGKPESPPATQTGRGKWPGTAAKAQPETAFTTTSPFGGVGGGLFSQVQGSVTTCREEEVASQQLTLIGTSEARTLFEDGSKSLFVDVRPGRDFVKGHIPGAVSAPAEEIEKRWSQLPKDRTLVLYESGESPTDPCAFSRNVARFLLARGFSPELVKVFQNGLAGWQKAGLPVAR